MRMLSVKTVLVPISVAVSPDSLEMASNVKEMAVERAMYYTTVTLWHGASTTTTLDPTPVAVTLDTQVTGITA